MVLGRTFKWDIQKCSKIRINLKIVGIKFTLNWFHVDDVEEPGSVFGAVVAD